ncbi:MAG: response regulator [Bryobacterales bacterium]|nr:response regulator [Bryobacterales bacterium]
MELHVLIVDDSPAMRNFIRRVLDLSGLEVSRCLEASNGEEALRVLEDHWVDAVLTDINMPEMDGEELLRQMSAHPVLRSIPVLVVSTDRTEARIQKMLTLGARGYVTKPFAPETLRDELVQSLGGGDGSN